MILCALTLAATAVSAGPSSHSAHPAPKPAVYAHRAVSSADAQTQALFDRGLTLFYAYNGSEGVHVFAQAAQRQPDVAMLYWGEALSYGRDINTSLDEDRFHKGHEAIEKAAALESATTPEERTLIEAMRIRYRGAWANHTEAETAYRAAMAAAVAKHPQDDDVAVLSVEAMLENSGNRLWKDGTSQPLNDDTSAMVNTLDAVIARNPAHIMANHLQIHIFEPSADRSRAVAAAKRLDAMNFAPEDEHLAHMTAHTWVDIGSYRLAVAASNRALALFDQYLATPGIDPAHASYIRHDTVVGFGAAMMLGNYAQAAALAERLDTSARTFRAPANYKMIAAVRFGRWADVAEATPKTPADPLHIPLAYGKLARGDVAGAKAELAGIDTNAGTAFTQALRAALLAQQGDRKGADAAFAVALAAEKEHNTGENLPTVPVGEIMGYTYYRLHDYAAAESAFRDTLARYPNNPRALYGLAESLNKLGKTAQAQAAAKDFSAAWRGSDSTLTTDNL